MNRKHVMTNGEDGASEPGGPDAVCQEAWALFVEFLKHRGDRITESRRIVFERVFARHDHFCADHLAMDLATGPSHVSRGTVYRTLDLMVAAGLVRKIRDSDVHAHFEHTYGHPEHEHMVCDRCGRFIEFRTPVIQEEIGRISRQNKFKVTRHRTMVFGICSACAEGG